MLTLRLSTTQNAAVSRIKWQARLAQALPFILLLLTAYLEFARSVDDPYITLRYATNLLAGYGLVFNPGERVEGFSSPLHLIISALVLRLLPHVDPLFKLKLFSLCFAYLALVQMRRLASVMGLDNRATILAQCIVALNINFAMVAVNGLETTLYVMLFLSCLAAYIAECRTGSPGKSGLILFVAALTRPEALVLFAALALVRAFLWRKRSHPRRFLIFWLLEFLVPFALCGSGTMEWCYLTHSMPNMFPSHWRHVKR